MEELSLYAQSGTVGLPERGGHSLMEVRAPSEEEVRRLGKELRLDLTDAEVDTFCELGTQYAGAYGRIAELVDEREHGASAQRTVTSYSATGPDNVGNAWAARCRIEGTSTGSLSGKRIAIKDNICVDGVPMLVGSPVMKDFVPHTDAVAVERVLACGGIIVGKTAVPGFCFDGTSITGFPEAQVHNPWRSDYSAGGSSGGNAAVLVNGEADMALGTDTAGSIRIPASWSGCCGLKPTYGLVPSAGIFPIERTLDHVGPMANTVLDCALLLDAVAGPDPAALQLDPQRPPASTAIHDSVEGVRVGLLSEGFALLECSESDVDEAVQSAADLLGARGVRVFDLSIPMHRDAVAVWAAILFEGASDQLMAGDGVGTNWRGRYARRSSWQRSAHDAAQTGMTYHRL